jgi:hypothetical protein
MVPVSTFTAVYVVVIAQKAPAPELVENVLRVAPGEAPNEKRRIAVANR